MGKLADLGQNEPLLLGGKFDRFVLITDSLPAPATLDVGECRFLSRYQEGYLPSIIYIVKNVDGEHKWIRLDHTEEGIIDAPYDVWKRIAPDSIILHWKSPDDIIDEDDPYYNATWDYDVVVKKHGEAPTSPDDGEIVGYSAVRSQYAEGSGFVDTLDDMDKDYIYRIFSVSKGGVWSGSDVINCSWEWREIKEQISLGLHKKVFRVGDVFEMPAHEVYGTLNAQIVDFDAATYTSGEKPTGSITFMTVEVLGNMSFDNKELRYARVFDEHFKSNKKYFQKKFNDVIEYVKDGAGNLVLDGGGNPQIDYVRDPVTGDIVYDPHSGEPTPKSHKEQEFDDDGNPVFEQFDIIANGYKAGNQIPAKYLWETGSESDRLYEEHPSIRYWYDPRSKNIEDDDELEQLFYGTAVSNGCSFWRFSNLRSWLTSPIPADTSIYDGVNEEMDPVNWTNVDNGWFHAVEGAYHNVAPGSLHSGTYIEQPCFQSGFIDNEFVPLLMNQANITITDLYVHRFVRENNINDAVTDGIVNSKNDPEIAGAFRTQDDRFWIPSFEQIYGRKPTFGSTGEIIEDRETSRVHEGSQFALFKDGANRDLLVKYDPDGNPMNWYTRTCDPFVPSRLFYIPSTLPAQDTGSYTDLTCTAHRFTIGDELDDGVGPAVCFSINAGEARTVTLVNGDDERRLTVSSASKYPVYTPEAREGYRFTGWYESDSGTQYFDENLVAKVSNIVFADVTLETRWVKVYNLKIHVITPDGEQELDTREYTLDEHYAFSSKLFIPTLANHTFYGWFTRWEVDSSKPFTDNSGMVANKSLKIMVDDNLTSDLEIWSCFVPNKIDVVSNTSNVKLGEATVEVGTSLINIHMPKTLDVSGITRPGYNLSLSYMDLTGIKYTYTDGKGDWSGEWYLQRAPFHIQFTINIALKTSWS